MNSRDNYGNKRIHKIWSLETPEIYVGSTCQELYKRMSKHRCEARTRGVFRLHQGMSRLGCKAFSIELIENNPCSNMTEWHKREGEITRELGESLDMRIAGRSHKECAEEHQDKIGTYKNNGMTKIRSTLG